MRDLIVYGQQELEQALRNGVKSITLCSGFYRIPKTYGVIFDRLGPVKAEVLCSKPEADAAGMVFIDTYPSYKSSYAAEFRASMEVVAAFTSGSGSSFAASGSGVYGSGSFGSGGGSHYYEYEFEYGGSYRGSFGGSYSLSFGYSLTGSAGGSYSLLGSAGGSYSVLGSCRGADAAFLENRTIRVFGYGINLI